MMLSFFSILLAIGIVIPIIGFTLIWCKNRMVNKMRWIHLRREVLLVGTLIFSIFLIPMVSTPLYTNPDLDTQFTEVFGTSWSQIQGDQRFAPLPKKEYSLYQNIIFGSIPSNTRFNTSYISDPPSFRLTGHTMENQTFTFDAYLPQSLSFGQEGDTEGTLLPVIIMLHGEYEDKGEWNANLTSQYLANLGFLVCDMNYGSIRTNNFGINATGYYISDMIRQIGYFTQYLAERRYEYRADMSSVYFSGRHLGGGLSLICGFGYNNTLAHLFSPEMNVKGIIPYYPTSDIGKSDTGFALSILTEGHTILNGSSDPSSPYYNEDWNNYNPIQLANRSIGLPPVFLITGTHDVLIPMRYQENFVQTMRNNGHTIIFGKYLLGSDGFDGNHNSPYGKSILYYYSRFLFLTL
jgi:acetyl esterase/lipase